MIPQFIYQTYPKGLDLPEPFKENIKKICLLNPSWSYRLFDDDQMRKFIFTNYDKRMVDLYDLINPVYGPARADFFRYLLLYSKGGIYLDIKASVQKSFDQIIFESDTFVTSHWDAARINHGWGQHECLLSKNPRGEYVNWFIISEARHPILKRVIERVISKIQNYDSLRDGVGKIGVLRTTGPIPYSMAIEDLMVESKQLPFRIADYSDLGLVYSIFESDSGSKGHHQFFSPHYTTLKEPIINTSN